MITIKFVRVLYNTIHIETRNLEIWIIIFIMNFKIGWHKLHKLTAPWFRCLFLELFWI